MKIAKVIGNIGATRNEPRLSGYKLLLLQPENIIDASPDGPPIVATDLIGAGVGEAVIYVGGSSARSASGDMSLPVDATVIAIIDNHDVNAASL